MLTSYGDYNNLKETDPAYNLIAEIIKYCVDRNESIDIKINSNNTNIL